MASKVKLRLAAVDWQGWVSCCWGPGPGGGGGSGMQMQCKQVFRLDSRMKAMCMKKLLFLAWQHFTVQLQADYSCTMGQDTICRAINVVLTCWAQTVLAANAGGRAAD